MSSLETIFQSISTSSPDHVEQQLHVIHKDVIHDLRQTELFILILHTLSVPPASISSSWFDLVLRPALHNPSLSPPAATQAKNLVLSALGNKSFAKHLFDLYLVDAVSEASEVDVLELAALDKAQRLRAETWRCHLEDIMLGFAHQDPDSFLELVGSNFDDDENTRLRLCLLLNRLPCLTISNEHPLFISILDSLLLDNSTTLCSVALTVLCKVFPSFTHEMLMNLLPRLLVVLARICDWKVLRPKSTSQRKTLQGTFHVPSFPPDPHQYFAIIYYLFPCNVLSFLRQPSSCFSTRQTRDLPYETWPFDDDSIRITAAQIIQAHGLHPSILSLDEKSELETVPPWADYDLSQRVTEANLLSIQDTITQPPPRFDSITDMNEDSLPGMVFALQRQLILARTQLNFEVWITAHNAKHIKRLSSDKGAIPSSEPNSSESSQQALLYKLRAFRMENSDLKKEITELKGQNAEAKRKYVEWNSELLTKNKSMREEMRILREGERGQLGGGSYKELKALFDAQATLLASANDRVFALEVEIKETDHKLRMLRDYEARIKQHLELQRLWDEDFKRFNDREQELRAAQTAQRQMVIELEALRQASAKVEAENREMRMQLVSFQRRQQISAFAPRTVTQTKLPKADAAMSRLRVQNHALQEELEELRAMVEILRGRALAASAPAFVPAVQEENENPDETLQDQAEFEATPGDAISADNSVGVTQANEAEQEATATENAEEDISQSPTNQLETNLNGEEHESDLERPVEGG